MKVLDVLIACEFSGVVRDAFIAKGHNAISCDLLDTDSQGPHIKGDVRDLLKYYWDLIIAHPPCTYLCNSGVQHLHTEPGRWDKLKAGGRFFRALLEADCGKIAVENPIPHCYAVKEIGRKYDQIIHPYQFGHMERKSTCLWLKNLPKLKPTKNVKAEMLLLPKSQQQKMFYLSPGKNRAKIRSITYQGIADAMADQWSF